MSINRQWSLLAMTAVRLAGRLRAGGKVLPCSPLIWAFNESRQHTAPSCYCSSDATRILWLMFRLLLMVLSFQLGLRLRVDLLEMFYFETIYLLLDASTVNPNVKLLHFQLKIVALANGSQPSLICALALWKCK